MFAGPHARTGDHAALKHAAEIASGGHTPEEIWKKRVGFRALMGMRRFEILDDKLDIARLSNQSLRQEPTVPCARAEPRGARPQ